MKDTNIRCAGILGGAVLLLLLVGCATTPADRIKRNPEVYEAFPSEVRENVREGRIELGYGKDAVEMALGRPGRVITRETEKGEEIVWVYMRSRPRFGVSVGTAYGTGGRSAVGGGVGTRTGGRDAGEERMRVVFFEGEVIGIERRE